MLVKRRRSLRQPATPGSNSYREDLNGMLTGGHHNGNTRITNLIPTQERTFAMIKGV